MKLRMPAGLEKSEMKETVSPMTGQPIVPGMSLISFEELRDLNHRRPAQATARATRTGAPKMAMADTEIAVCFRYVQNISSMSGAYICSTRFVSRSVILRGHHYLCSLLSSSLHAREPFGVSSVSLLSCFVILTLLKLLSICLVFFPFVFSI